MEQDQKILKWIKTLLDKASSTDSLAEKESCMLKVQELLQKYQIESSRVTSYEDVKREGVEEDRISYQEDWEVNLLSGIVRNNFCKIVIHSYAMNISCIGKPSNVTACLYLFSFFRNAILQLSVTAYTGFLQEIGAIEDKTIKLPRGHKEKFIHNYLAGAVSGVIAKMSEQLNQAKVGSSDLRGLMIVNDDAVEIYMKKHYPRLGFYRCGSKGSNAGSNAFNQGIKDGYGLSANKGVETNTKRIG